MIKIDRINRGPIKKLAKFRNPKVLAQGIIPRSARKSLENLSENFWSFALLIAFVTLFWSLNVRLKLLTYTLLNEFNVISGTDPGFGSPGC